MKKLEDNFDEQIKWVRHLPDSGGSWGSAILQTVEGLQPDLEKMLIQKAALDEKVKQVRKVLRGTVVRADKEAEMLYTRTQINQAKQKVAPPPLPTSHTSSFESDDE